VNNFRNRCLFMLLFTTISVHTFAEALCSKRCISEMAALICVRDAPLESLLNGLIGCKFISSIKHPASASLCDSCASC